MSRPYTPNRQTYRGRRRTRLWLAILCLLCAAAILAFLIVRLVLPSDGQMLPAPTGSTHMNQPSLPPTQTTPADTQPVPVTAPPSASETAPVQAVPAPSAVPSEVLPPQTAAPASFEPVEGSVVPAQISEVAVPQGEAHDKSWFSNAVMVGDSRIDGFRLYSGVTECDYIVRTGMSVYDVADEKPVIRVGEEKQTVYQALGEKQYAKVYLSMGVNELGYYNPEVYGKKYSQIVDQVRTIQPNAQVYVMTIIPVNTKLCAENDQKSWITNEWVAKYNAALVGMAAEKGVMLLNPVEVMQDETGELREDLASDGVHFKKVGYELWRDYLLSHTGEAAGE